MHHILKEKGVKKENVKYRVQSKMAQSPQGQENKVNSTKY